jgi:hypothetical protein
MTAEALEDHFGAASLREDDLIAAFSSNQHPIEHAARRLLNDIGPKPVLMHSGYFRFASESRRTAKRNASFDAPRPKHPSHRPDRPDDHRDCGDLHPSQQMKRSRQIREAEGKGHEQEHRRQVQAERGCYRTGNVAASRPMPKPTSLPRGPGRN